MAAISTPFWTDTMADEDLAALRNDAARHRQGVQAFRAGLLVAIGSFVVGAVGLYTSGSSDPGSTSNSGDGSTVIIAAGGLVGVAIALAWAANWWCRIAIGRTTLRSIQRYAGWKAQIAGFDPRRYAEIVAWEDRQQMIVLQQQQLQETARLNSQMTEIRHRQQQEQAREQRRDLDNGHWS
ncbi:hypothetical protein BH24ACT5_BH24ACT5_06970 [soil metagenome]